MRRDSRPIAKQSPELILVRSSRAGIPELDRVKKVVNALVAEKNRRIKEADL